MDQGLKHEALYPEVDFRAGSIVRDPWIRLEPGGRVWVSSLLRRKAPAWVAAHPRSSKHRERLLRPPRQGRALCPRPREGHRPSGRSVLPRRGCLSQRPPTVTPVEEKEERGDLGVGRGAGSAVGGLHSSRDTWDVLGAPGIRAWPGSPMDHPGRGAGGGKATCDREEDEVSLRKGMWLPVPPRSKPAPQDWRVSGTLCATPSPVPVTWRAAGWGLRQRCLQCWTPG